VRFVLSIDWFRAGALTFLRVLQCRLPHHTPQAVTPNFFEEIHVHRIAQFSFSVV
jgi:hypothetical protein